MDAAGWLTVHLVATAVLAGAGWVVQLVVYPGFRRVGPAEWAAYHAAHLRGMTRVVALPWLAQGISTAALLLAPPPGAWVTVVLLALLALGPVVLTVAVAVPAHRRLGHPDRDRPVRVLLRANLARTLAWTTATGVAAAASVAG